MILLRDYLSKKISELDEMKSGEKFSLNSILYAISIIESDDNLILIDESLKGTLEIFKYSDDEISSISLNDLIVECKDLLENWLRENKSINENFNIIPYEILNSSMDKLLELVEDSIFFDEAFKNMIEKE
ncbi:hypothetical protein ACSXBA_15155 (plasmid) [Clostridium perfringens]|jgi:2-hydroxy-3-keto-5-methylthiopentenyl-1-phosphate phosphatase|uniref:Uncharacterized protein n=1 Tax=Clostridium perfringens (strain 13 / Type A) TaxID=195102 RepID=Q93MC2_CLOPE|nr:hypothetical protein [Clostridium perfringens]MBI6039890.1 hypothetical protein [Clostridium perfringens]MDH2340669.1 hypothetical protein [Clostridium perfringens]MDM0695765.1 hypothetical protein [Clostridium perfringens]MDN4738282.1 hypothetical protein [Clostridium perfringens]MDN4738337.1 hypothetical protein [Clostridium perfringens]